MIKKIALVGAIVIAGCQTYKEVKEVVHDVEKSAEKPKEERTSEIPHEGALLDNKVTASRIKDALTKTGPQFDKVEVKATKDEVILTGTVASAQERTKAVEIAKSLHRKMKLVDQLRVGKQK